MCGLESNVYILLVVLLFLCIREVQLFGIVQETVKQGKTVEFDSESKIKFQTQSYPYT